VSMVPRQTLSQHLGPCVQGFVSEALPCPAIAWCQVAWREVRAMPGVHQVSDEIKGFHRWGVTNRPASEAVKVGIRSRRTAMG